MKWRQSCSIWQTYNYTNTWNAFEIIKKKATTIIHNVTRSHTQSPLSPHTHPTTDTHTRTDIYTHTHTFTHTNTHMHTHKKHPTCITTHTHTYTHTHNTCTHTQTHARTHKHTHKHMRRQRLRWVPLLLLVAPPQRQWVPERWPGCPQRWPRIHSAACLKQGSRITHLFYNAHSIILAWSRFYNHTPSL